MTTPEGKIKDKVKAYLDSIGAYYFMPVQMGYGKRTLDFLVCYRGQFIAIEAKRPGGVPDAFQQRIINEIIRAHGRCYVVDSVEKLALVQDDIAKQA
jgi:hypothetical protein